MSTRPRRIPLDIESLKLDVSRKSKENEKSKDSSVNLQKDKELVKERLYSLLKIYDSNVDLKELIQQYHKNINFYFDDEKIEIENGLNFLSSVTELEDLNTFKKPEHNLKEIAKDFKTRHNARDPDDNYQDQKTNNPGVK